MSCMNTRERILYQYKKYPQLQIQDLFKFLYQSCFGCEHFVTDFKSATSYIESERSFQCTTKEDIEELDGNYVRLYLSYPILPSTFAKLFMLSAREEKNAILNLEVKLKILADMVKNRELPFCEKEVHAAIQNWKEKGYPSLHHSQTFRQTYHPSYRLIKKEFVPFLPVFKFIDRHPSSILAIDGRCASGKTTLSSLLEKIYDCNVFHMDDFFLQPEQRSQERLNTPGENVDHERFEKEVLKPLKNKQKISYIRFDCSTCILQAPKEMAYKPLNIIEGSYSMHPSLESYYNYKIFLTLQKEEQFKRLQKRNPNMLNNFIQQWIPLEEKYFDTFQIQKQCNLSIDTTKA